MDKFVINGGNPLTGEVTICGAKNAAVAIIPATILSDEPCRLENIPDISDVIAMFDILEQMGATVEKVDENSYIIDATKVDKTDVLFNLARNMRASYYLLGALLSKKGRANVAMPGGCFFGTRPIDQHLKGFSAMGATYRIVEESDSIEVYAENLTGASVYMDVVSVGATMNVMLAAVKAKGVTIIENAAREPHIVDLANFLNTMGAQVKGAGTDVIKITGVTELKGATYSIIPDQIEAGTYMAAVAATRGKATIKNVTPKHLDSITAKLEEMGVIVEEGDDSIYIDATNGTTRCNIKTKPHPGFPTDMQPQIVALLAVSQGTSIVREDVWESRFQYVDQLKKMGARISVDGRVAIIDGVKGLQSADVTATDLRAGAALIIASLCAEGESTISSIKFIERGYDRVIEKFRALGADISKVSC
ncbi:MAG: UDP-N-acetylglucosamine 1-carboxyvinyltransferase [Clostridia bacterium]|nr:UDP-N-acetylglucosamine 1-carboxyvinyltransferase [Clostridia bacterium]MEE1125103.1 UDP-N-acetylglucosamine 1-carboxyvinyltransferase [Acutalibacteraceae bacterium]